MKNNNLYIKTVTIFSVFLCICFALMMSQMLGHGILLLKKPRPIPREPMTSFSVEATETEKKISSAVKTFTPDGQMLIIKDADTDSKNKERRVYDNNYNLLWEGDIEQMPAKYFILDHNRRTLQLDSYLQTAARSLTPDMKRSILISNRLKDDEQEYWRYNNDGYFEGFAGGHIIGYLASNGFVKNKSELIEFKEIDFPFAYTEDLEDCTPILLCKDNNNLYMIDIKNRQFELLCENIGKAQISLHNWFKKGFKKDINYEYDGAILIERSEEKPVVIFRKNLKAIEINGIDIDSRAYSLSMESAGHLIPQPEYKNYVLAVYRKDHPGKFSSKQEEKQWLEKYSKSRQTMTYLLYSLSDNGDAKLISEENSIVIPGKSKILNEAQIESYLYKTNTVFDLSPVAFHYLYNSDFVTNAKPGSKVIKETIDTIRTFKPRHVSVAWVLGCACAVGVFVHNRHRTANKFAIAGWMAFALLFNVAGLLTCLALTHYDLIKCDNCGRKRHLLTEACLHCGKVMVAPLPQETDIISG